MGSTLLFALALLKVSPGHSWAQPSLGPYSLRHRSIPRCDGAGGKSPQAGGNGFFLLMLSLCRSRAGG